MAGMAVDSASLAFPKSELKETADEGQGKGKGQGQGVVKGKSKSRAVQAETRKMVVVALVDGLIKVGSGWHQLTLFCPSDFLVHCIMLTVDLSCY